MTNKAEDLKNEDMRSLNVTAKTLDVMFSLLKKVDDVDKIKHFLTEKYFIFGAIGRKIDPQTTKIHNGMNNCKVCKAYYKDNVYFENYNGDVYYFDITRFGQMLVRDLMKI